MNVFVVFSCSYSYECSFGDSFVGKMTHVSLIWMVANYKVETSVALNYLSMSK